MGKSCLEVPRDPIVVEFWLCILISTYYDSLPSKYSCCNCMSHKNPFFRMIICFSTSDTAFGTGHDLQAKMFYFYMTQLYFAKWELLLLQCDLSCGCDRLWLLPCMRGTGNGSSAAVLLLAVLQRKPYQGGSRGRFCHKRWATASAPHRKSSRQSAKVNVE